MAAKDNDDAKPETQEDAHSLDMSQAAVKKMISEAREKGYITYDQLNQVLPPDQVSSDQIEDVMSMLSEMGIQVTEEEETEEDNASKGGTELVDASKGKDVALSSGGSEKLDRTDDRLVGYISDMLFSREVRFLEELGLRRMVRFASSSMAAQREAIRSGAGLGILPRFMALNDPGLVPVLTDRYLLKRTVWIVSHQSTEDLARVRSVSEYLQRAARSRRGALLLSEV